MVKAFTLLQMELKEKFRYKIEIFSASTDAILLIFPSIAIPFIRKSRNIWHSKQNRIYTIHVIFINSLAICGKHVVSSI